jgi:hypothetical protein
MIAAGGADFALHIGARQRLDLNLRLVGLGQEIAVLHRRHEGAAQRPTLYCTSRDSGGADRCAVEGFCCDRQVPPPPFLDRTWIDTFDATREEPVRAKA